MNLNIFASFVNEINNSDNNLKLFRIWANNTYVSYKKIFERELQESKRDFEEDDFFKSDEFNDLKCDWLDYSYYDILSLYSEMGWEVDNSLKNRELTYFGDQDFYEYDANFFEIYDKIQSVKSDVEYCYALLIAIKKIPEHTILYKHYASLVYAGLNKFNLSKLEPLMTLIKQSTVFVAMSFNNDMNSARKQIEKAICDSGYQPILIDTKEYNDQIVPEIYKEIENSKFIIADLSGQRGGVYYEAGYAKALDKDIILTCKDSEKKDVHFDVAQINTIFWKDENDLHDRLVRRIEATVGKSKTF